MLKEKAINWYLKNIEMPKKEIQDHPGFMGENLSGQDIYLRDIALPEELFVMIENKIDEPELLYKIGKQFGYRYARVSGLKRYSELGEEKFRDSTFGVMKYMESVSYWKNGNIEINYDQKIQILELEEIIECNKNGKGNIFVGAAAGLWSYRAEDKKIEGVQERCQGRGDEKCIIKCGPRSEIDSNFEIDIDSDRLDISDNYKIYNEIKDTNYAQNSFKDFEEIGFFEHREGLFYHKDFRYIWAESSLIELIGSELGDKYEKELFDSAFKIGKEIAEEGKEGDMQKFIVEYLSATGWGDTNIKQKDGDYQVHSLMFPWTKFSSNSNFPVFRGIVSGMMTEFKQRDIKLKNIQKDDKGGIFSIIIDE